MNKTLKLAMVGLLVMWTSQSIAEVPFWAKQDTLKKHGDLVTAICNGTGPTVSIARSDAINSCQASVSQFLNGEVKVNALSIETEKSVGFHQEVEQKLNVNNFNCNPKKDEFFEKDGSFQFWIMCEFDIKKASIVKEEASLNVLSNKDSLDLKAVSPNSVGDLSEGRVIFIETVPQCESILVQGLKPRVVECNKNPMKFILDEHDEKAIIRATKYQPKAISLKERRSSERLSIVLEKN